jgi:hypothetical protein
MAEPTGTTPVVDANQVELMKQIADLMKQQVESFRQIAEASAARRNDEEKTLQQIQEANTRLQKQYDAAQQNSEQRSDALKEYIKGLNEQYEKGKKSGELSEQALENLKERLKELKKEDEKLDEFLKKEKKRLDFGKDILSNMKDQLASATGLSQVVTNMNAGLTFTQSVFAQMVSNAGALVSTILKADAEYAKQTGQIADRTAMFGYGLSSYGIGFEKLNQASISLFKSMANFSNQTKEMREQLAATSAKLELLGISAATTGKTLESLTLGLKMSTDEAARTTEEMARAAIGAGIAPQKMADEFAANIGKLSAYGKQGVQVYIDMQKQAKSLGMELSTLNGIVGDQFDTFEAAARAAGKLNAVLGGNYLNSVEMLNATESERILILKRSFDESGKNFDSLSKYEKKAVAATLGISDLNEASKLFGKSTTDLTMDMEKQAATQEKLAKVQKEAAEVTDKMKEIFNGLLIIVKPIVSIIQFLVGLLAKVADAFGGFGSIILTTIFAIYAFGGSIEFSTGKLGGLWKSIKEFGSGVLDKINDKLGLFKKGTDGAAEASTKASGGMAESIKKIGSAASESGKGLLYLGGAILMIGAGIGLAALGLAQLVSAFNNLQNAGMALLAVTVVMGGFIAMVVLLAVVGVKASIGLIPLGIALLMIGGAIALAAYSIAKMVESIATLISSMSAENVDKFSKFGSALDSLGNAFSAAGNFSEDSMNKISSAIDAIGASVAKLEESKLTSFASSMYNLVEIMKFEGISTAANGVASAITQIGAALETLPEGKEVSLKTLNETLNVAKTITEDQIKPTTDFINVAKEYYQVQATAKEASKDALVQAMKEATKAFTAVEKDKEVTLVIKGGDLASLLKGETTTLVGLMNGPRTKGISR